MNITEIDNRLASYERDIKAWNKEIQADTLCIKRAQEKIEQLNEEKAVHERKEKERQAEESETD